MSKYQGLTLKYLLFCSSECVTNWHIFSMCCGHPQGQTRMASSGNQLEILTVEKISHKIDLLSFQMRFHTMETVWWFLKKTKHRITI